MQKIVVDVRMIKSSGIGRYIRASLMVLAQEDNKLVLLGDPAMIRQVFPDLKCEIQPFRIPIYDPREQFALAKAIQPCDVYFSPHMTTTGLRVEAKIRVLTVHDAYHLSELADFGLTKRLYSRFIYRLALAVSDRVITVSEFTRDELSKLFPKYINKLRVVPNFIDKDIFYPDIDKPKTINGDYVLFVGNLKPHKNLTVAIQAIEKTKPEHKLVIVGAESGFRHGMGKELKRYKAMENIHFLGQVDDHELRRLYSHAICFIFPSFYEGFGYPPLEAMACGCPVICSDIPALHETCGSAAVFCDAHSSDEFARGIEYTMVVEKDRSNLIKAGFKRVDMFSKARFESGLRSAIWGGR